MKKFNTKLAVGGNSEDFVSLKDGQNVEGLLLGEPYEFYQHWVGDNSTDCTGKGCVHCVNGIKTSFRFRINLATKATDGRLGLAVKIFEQGKKAYKLLTDLEDAGFDLGKTKVRISRTGSGKQDTSYSVLPMPNGVLTSETLAHIAKLSLHDLSLQTTAADDNGVDKEAQNSYDNVPPPQTDADASDESSVPF